MPSVGPETLPVPLLSKNVHKASVTPAGSGTKTLAPVTGSPELLVTTMV
jgi:hypothetical protein